MPKIAVIYLIVGSLFFSGSALFVKLCQFTAADKTFFRLVIPCLITAIIILSKKVDFNFRSRRLWLGSLINFIRLYLFVWALDFTAASTATVLAYTSPAFTALNSAWILKEKLNTKIILGISLGFIGVIVSYLDHLGKFELNLGLLIILTSSFLFSLNNIMIKKDLEKLSPTQVMFWQNLVGTLALVLFIKPVSTNQLDLVYACLFGIFAGFLGFHCFYRALKMIPLNIASAFTYTEIIFVFIWSSLFLNEEIGLKLIIATLLIIFGNYLLITAKLDYGTPREST